MEITFLGAAREVGRSAILFSGEKRVLMDYGAKIYKGSEQGNEYPLRLGRPIDAFVLSHAHLDHSGCVPMLYERAKPICLATYPTQALTQLIVQDFMKIAGRKTPFTIADYKKMVQNFFPVPYGRELEIGTRKTKLRMHDAGHIPGAAICELHMDGKRAIYSGDFKIEGSMLHKGAEYVDGDVDVLVMESTYSKREHPPRKDEIAKLVKEIRGTMEAGGVVLMPAFAIGRAQELVMILHEHVPEAEVFLDGMAKGASEIIMNYPGYVRDAEALARAMDWAQWVETPAHKRKALQGPSVIVTTAGMLDGGPAVSYLLRMNEMPENRIIFTGYCVENTNGWHLMKEGRIKAESEWVDIKLPWSYYDLSAHAGRTELLEFVKRAAPEKVLLVHGDDTEGFAAELKGRGYDAHAPAIGETVKI